MSIYTEAEHVMALSDTLKWIDHPPASPEARYAYGCYQLRLKDYNEALRWLLHAAGDGVEAAWFDIARCLSDDLIDASAFSCPLPDADSCWRRAYAFYAQAAADTADAADTTPQARSTDAAKSNTDAAKSNTDAAKSNTDAAKSNIHAANSHALYRLGYLLRFGLGTEPDTYRAFELFSQVLQRHADLRPEHFNITCNYSIEGSGVTSTADICKLPLGDACFALAVYYLDGIAPVQQDIAKGRQLLKQAWDYHCEDALLLDFKLFGQDYPTYPYQDDIREQYSFIIGQYGRVCDVHPSGKAYRRLIAMYENGYPGDEGQRKNDFALKAKPFYKKMLAISPE